MWALTPLQEGLLFLSSFADDGPDVYTVQLVLELDGGVDRARRRGRARRPARPPPQPAGRVPARRRRADRCRSWPAPSPVACAEVDLRGRTDGRRRTPSWPAVAHGDRVARFDLARPPLLRATLVRTDAGDRLVVTAHHIVVDGWSMPLLVEELAGAVRGRRRRRRRCRPRRPFARYLRWLAGRDQAEARAAWAEALAGVTEPTLVAPPDPDRPARAARGRRPRRCRRR